MKKSLFNFEVTEIGKDTYLINEFYSTMFVLCGSKRALVIDCGTGVGDFKGTVEKITPLPYDVVLTHAHVDHVGGRGQFSDIFVTDADKSIIKLANLPLRKGYILLYKFSGTDFCGLNVKKVKNEPRVHTIDNGAVFDLGGRTIKTFFTPGHTLGSVSYLDVENRTVFIGDVANENLLMQLPHSTTIDEMVVTIENLIAMDCYDTIWSSHHMKPQTKKDLEIFLTGAKQVAARKKNTFLPIIKTNIYEGAKLIYRTSHIHKK